MTKQSGYYSDADTYFENNRVPNQFAFTPRRYRLRRPVSPDNETLNKYDRGLDSLQELHNLDVRFDANAATSSTTSGSNYPYVSF
ncbi:hypothetical protein TELCIR_11410 [Teladorsagia circumcincta]|uniref:Uncharacterized protein n=1 Tax=Teladorsagia circumcincta TaxID=45464 RepID=A0A2G9UBJ1_TELCI|nr:hypothetical protein TELCIR_11410 [Teladorsagia circumcincta]